MASSPSPAGDDAAAAPGTAQPPTFTIQIVSPSLGVPSGLTFADLPPDTTIQRLRQTIRESLDSKPADGVQRLIHRGRLLSRDDQSLLEVFGEDALRSAERQTLHLVLRDLSDVRPASTQPIPPVAAVNAPQPPASAPAPAGGGPHTQPLPQQAPIAQAQHFFPGAAQPLMHAAIPPPNAPFGMVPPAAMGAPGAPTMPFGSHNQRAVATHHAAAQAHAAAHAQAHAAAQAQAQRQWAATMNAHMGTHTAAVNAANAANMDQQLLQELINRNQRERASAGRNGAQDSQQAPNLRPPTGGNTPGQSASPFQPDATRSVVREGVGPNGQQWRITVNESITTPQGFQRNPRTGSPFAMADVQNIWRPPSGASHPRSVPQGSQPGNLSAFDVQQMLRTADAGHAATRAMTDAMRRNASTSSLASLANSQSNQPIPPGVTTPLIPSRSGSAAGTPDPTRAGGRASNPPTSHPLSQPASSTPEVFILSSPEGPRALLVNGGLGAYYTPPMPAVALGQRPIGQHPLPQIPVPNLGPYFAQMPPRPAGNIWAPTPAENAALQLRNQQQQEAHAPAPPAQALPQQAAVHQHHPHPMVHQNVHIRAVALGQIWPHIWMVFRLMLFIWWFTSPSSSWTRWFTVISIAIALFLFNTGLLNPLADQVRIPVRRHLENLMPAADNHGRRRPERSNHDQSTGADGMPQPADTAARLVEERRRANANWLLTQFRRLERAGILFLASIAPGVAERHIANVEAEARAERERQEAREAEAAAASAAAAAEAEGSAAATTAAAENAEASGDANAAPGGEGSASATSPGGLPGAAPSGDDGNSPRAQNPAQEPLVAI